MVSRKITITTALICAASLSLCNTTFAQSQREERLKEHLYYLASDEMQGRGSGSEFSAKAAEYLISQYEAIGVEPFFEEGWKQTFEQKSHSDKNFFNVVGIIKGSDPVLSNEYIVIGAHFDHLGTKSDGTVYNGADDNASGSSALIEIARELKANQASLKRSVIIAGFDGEELGLFGSYALSKTLKDKGLIDNVKLMMSIDMVGWLKDGAIKIEGVGTIKNGKKTLLDFATKDNLNVNLKKYEREIMTATDTQGFAELGVATLDFCTGLKSPYHKPEDDPELIDYKGLDKISGYVADITKELSSNPEFGPSGKVAPKHRSSSNLIQIAPRVGIGPATLYFPDAKLTTNSGLDYEGGLSLKLNFGKWALMTSGLYEKTSVAFPIENSDMLKSSAKYNQTSVTVPAYLIRQSTDPMAKIFLGIGPVYRHVLDYSYSDKVVNSYDVKEDQFGWGIIFGMHLGPYCLSGEFRNPTSTIFKDKSVKAKLSTYTVGLSYWF